MLKISLSFHSTLVGPDRDSPSLDDNVPQYRQAMTQYSQVNQHNNGNAPFLMGKLTINGHFQWLCHKLRKGKFPIINHPSIPGTVHGLHILTITPRGAKSCAGFPRCPVRRPVFLFFNLYNVGAPGKKKVHSND